MWSQKMGSKSKSTSVSTSTKVLLFFIISFFLIFIVCYYYAYSWYQCVTCVAPSESTSHNHKPWIGNIEQVTLNNTDFRHVLHTGNHSQLVVMNVLPGQKVGPEIHPHVDQFIRVENGTGTFMWRSNESEPWQISDIQKDSAVFVPAGTYHEFHTTPTASQPLKVYTLYAPPEHPRGTIQPNPPSSAGGTN